MKLGPKNVPSDPTVEKGSRCPLDGPGSQTEGARTTRAPSAVEEPVVTAADLVRGFSECRDLASKVPVYVTHHGRPTHVLLGVDAFRSLSTQATTTSSKAANERLYALADWVDQAVIICDQDMRVTFVNRVARAICRKAAGEMIDHALSSVLPEIAGSLMEVHIRRTVNGGEPSAADIPSPFSEGAWLRLQSFPLDHSNVVMFRDITDDVQRHRMADVKAAIIAAMTVHGDIGYVRLSVRGAIENLDSPFSDMVCLPKDRLVGVLMADLVVTRDRPAFRAALERAMQGAGDQHFEVSLLNNQGASIRVKVSIVPLQGAYGMEGAVTLITLLDADAGTVTAKGE